MNVPTESTILYFFYMSNQGLVLKKKRGEEKKTQIEKKNRVFLLAQKDVSARLAWKYFLKKTVLKRRLKCHTKLEVANLNEL